jgi:hypothetical protein
MTIALSGTGGLFTRLGRHGGLLRNVLGFVGSSAPDTTAHWGSSGPTINDLADAINNIRDQYLASNTQLIDGLYTQRDQYRSVHGTLCGYLQGLAAATLIQMADDDVGLTARDLPTALKLLISQMTASVDSVKKPTVSVSVTAGTNNGTGVLVASVTGPTGVQLDYVLNENLDVLCTADSQQGGTLGQEVFSVAGDAAQTDALAWDWPKGSGASASLTAVDASVNAGSNYLVNSDFETFSVSNTPDSWLILVGAAGTDIFAAGSSGAYTGSNALQFTGTGGAPLSSIAQTFGSSSGTTLALLPDTVYAVNFWIKRSGSLAAGVVDVDLVDGSNAAVADDASTANKVSTAFGSMTTSYAAKNGFFRTPRVLPSVLKLRVRASTALTSGESVYLDRLALTPATQLYAGGPYAAAFSGATKFVLNDSFTIGVSNNYGSAFQKLAERLFGMRALGLQLPSASSPTIADSLIA